MTNPTRVRLFEDGGWDTGVQMAQLAVDGVHLVLYWDHTTSKYHPMIVGGTSERVESAMSHFARCNPAFINRCTSADYVLTTFHEFYKGSYPDD